MMQGLISPLQSIKFMGSCEPQTIPLQQNHIARAAPSEPHCQVRSAKVIGGEQADQ